MEGVGGEHAVGKPALEQAGGAQGAIGVACVQPFAQAGEGVIALDGLQGLGFVEVQPPPVHVAVLFWLLMAGPGKASVDHLLARR